MALLSDGGDEIWRHLNLSVRNWNISRRITSSCYLDEHGIVFEQDLSHLFEQLKYCVYLDIYGLISSKKVEAYRLMVQTRFSQSRFDVQLSIFRLWI